MQTNLHSFGWPLLAPLSLEFCDMIFAQPHSAPLEFGEPKKAHKSRLFYRKCGFYCCNYNLVNLKYCFGA